MFQIMDWIEFCSLAHIFIHLTVIIGKRCFFKTGNKIKRDIYTNGQTR